MLQILHDEFDHDRVVEIAEAWHAVGNQIVGIGEVGQSVENPLAIRTLE